MTVYGYARVSTIKQGNEGNSLEAQQQTLTAAGAETIFSETYTGTQSNRPQLDKLFHTVEAGDTVIFTKVDRIARSMQTGLEIVQRFQNLNVTVRVLQMGKEDVTVNTTSTGRLTFNMLLAFAQFEHDMIKERQREGIQLAKQQGKYQGRKRITIDNLQELKEQWEHREISKAEISRQLHISRDTIDRRFKELDAPRELEQ